MARIAIIGVGAIGGVIAGLLQSAGRHELILCTRSPLARLSVDTPDGVVKVHAKNATDSSEIAEVDWVLVATKSYDVATTAKWLERLCAKGAPVAVLQNGVEHRERFAPYAPIESILPVIVDCPAERQAPDKVRQRGAMHLKVPENAIGQNFVGLFAGTAADAVVVSDFQTVAWKKLCHNAAGVLPALVLKPAGVMRGTAIGEVARQLVRECVAVGRAEGAQLGDEIPDDVLRKYRASPPDSVNSLLADRLAGRSMEIDARNGVIVRLGKKNGVLTPVNGTVVALLEAMTQTAS